MHANECDQQSWNNKNVHREKPGKCRTRNNRAAQHKIHSPGPNHWHSTRNRCPNSQSPIGVLVESQYLAGEGHGERHQQEEHANHPGQLSRKLVRPEKEDLHHMDQDDRHHEIRAPTVQSSNEPTQRNTVIENLQAVPGLSGGRHINESQENPGDNLKHEAGQRSAAENVKPTCSLARHAMLCGFANLRAKLKPLIKPPPDFPDHAHVFLAPALLAVELPVVGISPALMNSFPSATL